MKIAVDAAADLARALDQEQIDAGIRPHGSRARGRRRPRAGTVGRLAEGRDVLVDVIGQRFAQGPASTAGAIACAAATVRPSASPVPCDAAHFRQPVEGRILVEASHLDRPFDRCPTPSSASRPLGLAR